MRILKKMRAFCKVTDNKTGEVRNQVCHFLWCKEGINTGLYFEVIEDVHIEEYLSEPDAWTGHTTKSGDDIYQGDIVEQKARDKWGKIFYSLKEGRFMVQNIDIAHYLSKFNVYGMEVVGNVHENPDLWDSKYENQN
ncbi:hypothetical protein HNP93_000978 [Methanococcus maripaludis]|uniref:YopX protein domain-containing protein n=1 Tax=Methanococcus maripaludis TaxID=39152 RepID=A0A7J9P6C6_METMI|nr:YopX family protein [Methanococcus maripaludis]MBA2858277.1 hypothetical protein [Methanococcus maripaludis]